MWAFQEEEVARCLKARPWLANRPAMPEHYFRSVVAAEWERDPWYTSSQAAPFIGLKDKNAVLRYIRSGRLTATRVPRVLPGSSGPDGCWLVRKSAIDRFLASHTRKQDHIRQQVASKAEKRLASGLPTKISTIWLLRCPVCGQDVRVDVHGRASGRQIASQFKVLCVEGSCSHGETCIMSTNMSTGLVPVERR